MGWPDIQAYFYIKMLQKDLYKFLPNPIEITMIWESTKCITEDISSPLMSFNISFKPHKNPMWEIILFLLYGGGSEVFLSNQSLTKPVNPKWNQSWIFIERADAEVSAPILWPPDGKSRFTDAGKDWRQEEKGATKDEKVGWHHQPNAHESEQTPGDGVGQRNLVCCSSWGCKESDSTQQPNNWGLRELPSSRVCIW